MQVQNFDEAYRNTLQTLNFSEEALAEGLFKSQQCDKATLRASVRAHVLFLEEALSQAKAISKPTFQVRNIELYCDTLTIDCSLSLSREVDGTAPLAVSIYARKLLLPPSQNNSLKVEVAQGSEFELFTPKLPDNFGITFTNKGSPVWNTRPVVEVGCYGIHYSYDADSINSVTAEQFGPPDVTLEEIDSLSLINADGTVQDKGLLNDDLPRLLQMQLLVAEANSHLDRQFSVNVLDYIIAASATPYNVYMNYQASSLRSILLHQADSMAVSSVNIYSSKQVLKARLQAALAFETSFIDFSAQSNTAQYRATNSLNLLSKSNDALETYAFLLEFKRTEFNNATQALSTASSIFKLDRAKVKHETSRFKVHVMSFEEEQAIKGAYELMKASVELTLAIGATIFTDGAAAETVPLAAGEVAEAAEGAQTFLAEWQGIYKSLKKSYDAIKPIMEAVEKLVKTVQEVTKSLGTAWKVRGGSSTLKPNIGSSDVFNATADWRRFGLEVSNMEESIREYDIVDKEDFFTALKRMVISGETAILAETNLIRVSHELATVTMQNQMESRNKDRLSKMIYKPSIDEKILGLIRRAMFERLLAIRGLVYLDFSTYCSAYNYHTLRNEIPFTLSPVKPVAEFLSDAAKLQGAIVSYGSRVLIQSRTFTLLTLCGYDRAQDLALDLSKGKPVKISINSDNSLWEGFSRIRVSTARCYLEGAQSTTADPKQSTKLLLKTNGHFWDLQDPSSGVPDSINGISSEKDELKSRTPLVRSFVGDARQLLFEYKLKDGVIVCDGLYGQARDYTKHTPITTWEISLLGSSSTTKNSLDFKAFSGIRLEFICEVVVRTGS